MSAWYLAVCQDCTPVLPQPFSDLAKRDEWILAHKRGTSHRVDLARQEDSEIVSYTRDTATIPKRKDSDA